MALKNYNITLMDFTNLFTHNLPLISKLNQIFGIETIEI